MPRISTENSSISANVCARISQAQDNPGIFLIPEAPLETRCGFVEEELSPSLLRRVQESSATLWQTSSMAGGQLLDTCVLKQAKKPRFPAIFLSYKGISACFSWSFGEMTRPAICTQRHLLIASFLEPQAYRFALLSPFSFLCALLFFSVSLPLLSRERPCG